MVPQSQVLASAWSCEELDSFLWVLMRATQMKGPHNSIQSQSNLKQTQVNLMWAINAPAETSLVPRAESDGLEELWR